MSSLADRTGPWSLGVRVLALEIWLAALPALAVASPSAPGMPLHTLDVAELRSAEGPVTRVDLPMEWSGEGAPVHLRLHADLGPAPRDLAAYIPGLLAHARVEVNGHVLEDRLAHADEPVPRGAGRIRLLRLPDALLQPGDNRIDLVLVGPRGFSLSPIIVGPENAAQRAHDERVLGAVVGPLIVGTIMCCLGTCVLVLWARRRSDTMYGYFGMAALGWGLHSVWTVLPASPLPGAHHVVWWTSMYSAFVLLLVIFSLRFSGRYWPRLERAIWTLLLAAPLALYAAEGLGALASAAEAWRACCVAMVAVAVLVVMRRALKRRDVASVLMVTAGAVSLYFGARDWEVAHAGLDNNPVYLTPYAGLPFVALVAWMLVDGFVQATRALEQSNARLETRVAESSTALRQALLDMQAAKERAESANRSKSNFLAAASHDLRQPIQALGLNLAAIPSAGLPASVTQALDRMRASLSALVAMFDALLDLSRMDAGVVVPRPVPFSLSSLLQRLGDDFAPLAEAKGLRLVLRPGHGLSPPNALADPILLERVVRNLLCNALQHTRRGGVLVRWRLDDDNARWQVAVWDTGCGIEPEEQPRVFGEFYQARAARGLRHEGLGLGLAIVERLSRLMDLRIRLDSRPARGTRFTLSLPATRLAASCAEEAACGPLPRRCCVAVVEDDDEVRLGMSALLKSWSCRVVEGRNARAVAGHWQLEGRPTVDAIVADYRLDDELDGAGAIDALRTAWDRPQLPAVVVTGETTPLALAKLAGTGLPWLAKPVAAQRLHDWLAGVVLSREGLEAAR